MRGFLKFLIRIVVLICLAVLAWFIWPEYGHKIIYRFTISPQKTLNRDIVLNHDKLFAGIDKHGNINYISNGAWINTVEDMYAPYIALNNPMAQKKPVFERIVYNKPMVFKSGDTITAVSFSGCSETHPYIHVDTAYSVYYPDTILIRSSISSAKKGVFIWVGDKLKTNTHSILFYVPGIGSIETGERDAVSPLKPYVAMLGRSNQVIGLYYTGKQVPVYLFYEWNWIASVCPVKLDSKPVEFTRALSTKSSNNMDYMRVADSQYKSFLAVQSGVMITASSYNIITDQGKTVRYHVYVTNIDDLRKHITGAALFAPQDIDTGKSYASISDVLYPGNTSVFDFTIKPVKGGDFYLYPAIVVDGNYIEGQWTRVFSDGAGWYSGDMHNHSVYSFNPEDYPVSDMTEAAQAKGLDILSLTDYNTFSHADSCRASSTAEFLCIPGEEIANPIWGHANAQFIQSRVYEFLSPQHWINETHRQGGMFFINHPYILLREWRDFNFKGYDGIEILNGNKIPMDPVNVRAFDKWDELNRKGMHLYGIADSDAHTPYAVGKYRNYVYATSFTVSAIEQGFKKGMFYVSNGPMLSFTIDGKPMGSTITIKKGQSIHIQSGYRPYAQSPENTPDFQKLILFKDGFILQTFNSPSAEYTYKPDSPGFYRVEVFTNDGGFAASNPVWVDVR